jgi:hypothetical protein
MATVYARPPIILVGLKDISKALGCGIGETRTYVRLGGLPVFRVGKSYAATRARLEEWAASRLPVNSGGPEGPDSSG